MKTGFVLDRVIETDENFGVVSLSTTASVHGEFKMANPLQLAFFDNRDLSPFYITSEHEHLSLPHN